MRFRFSDLQKIVNVNEAYATAHDRKKFKRTVKNCETLTNDK